MCISFVIDDLKARRASEGRKLLALFGMGVHSYKHDFRAPEGRATYINLRPRLSWFSRWAPLGQWRREAHGVWHVFLMNEGKYQSQPRAI